MNSTKGDSQLVMQIRGADPKLNLLVQDGAFPVGFSERTQSLWRGFGALEQRFTGPRADVWPTHLINLLVHPIPANQRLDVAPDQEGGENQEDEEPGEQESQAHAAARGGEEAPAVASQSRERAGRDLPVAAAAPRVLPEPEHAELGRALRAGSAGQRHLPARREELLLPNPPAQAGPSKLFRWEGAGIFFFFLGAGL